MGAIALFLAASPLAFAAEKSATSAKKPGDELVAKDVKDVKTFDFERIFAEANRYFEAARDWERVKCYPKTSFVCSKRECPKIKTLDNTCMILDKKSKTIAICKDHNCRYLPATFDQTGVFINGQMTDSTGIFIRVLGDSRFKEITMVGLDAYITNGECERIDEKGNKIETAKK